VAVDAGPGTDSPRYVVGTDAVNVAAEDGVHVDPASEFVVAAAEVRECHHVVDARLTEFRNGLLRCVVGVSEAEGRGLRIDRVRRRVREAEKAHALAVGLGNRPRDDALVGAERVAVLVAGVGGDPGERAVGDDVAGHVRTVVEVVVAERVGDGVDGVRKVEYLSAAGGQRDHAGRGVVAGTDDEGVFAVEFTDTPHESGRPFGVVEEVLDIRVVEETNH